MTPRCTYPAPNSPIEGSSSHRSVLIAFSLIWVLIIVGTTAAAWLFLVFVAIGASVGANDGGNRVPQLLLHLLPIASALLLGGGLWFINWLCKPKPSNRRQLQP